VLTGEKVKG